MKKYDCVYLFKKVIRYLGIFYRELEFVFILNLCMNIYGFWVIFLNCNEFLYYRVIDWLNG